MNNFPGLKMESVLTAKFKILDFHYRGGRILKECVFCRNIVTEKEANIFYSNEDMIGFMDKFPVEIGHVLLIPRKHFENIFDIDPDIYIKIQYMARYVAMAVRDVFNADGINIGQNNGESARQIVMHYHLHIIPRHRGDNIQWERIKQSDDELKESAMRIEKRLKEIINGDTLDNKEMD